MKKPSLTALNFVGQCLIMWHGSSRGHSFSAKIYNCDNPREVITQASEDLNAALDLFAALYSNPSEVMQKIGEWTLGNEEEEYFGRLRNYAFDVEIMLDEVYERPQAVLNLVTRFLRSIDQLRASIAQSLLSIAVDQIGNQSTDDLYRKIDDVLRVVQESAKDSHDSKVAAETLLADKVRATAKRRAAGQAAYQKQLREDVNASERQRAQEDMDKALQRVHDRVENGEQVLSACRAVCSHFKNIGSGKNATWSPLTGRDGNPIQAQTLARYYRKKKNKRNATTA